MKKLLYIFLLMAASAATFTSCTEEEVTPKTESDSGGGTAKEVINR